MTKTIYCLVPKVSIESYVDLVHQRVITITPPTRKKIRVQLDKQSFRDRHCNSCTLKIAESDLIKAMKDAHIMPSTLNKITYCSNNGLCTSSDQMLSLCPAGHSFNTLEEVEVNVPKLLWVYNWNVTGKEQFKLYAVKEEDTDNYSIVPYLLSNVYTKPLACISWPKNQSRPNNLKQAYQTYWDSPFSDESWVVENNQSYIQHLTTYNALDSDEVLKLYTNGLIKFVDVEGLFYTEDEKIVKTVPKRINTLEYLLGTVKQGANNNWLLTINNHLFNKTGKLSGTAKLTLLG